MDLKLDIEEIKRYMSYEGELDDVTFANLNKAIALIKEKAQPKYTFNIFDLEIEQQNVRVLKTTLNFNSDSLAWHLKGCHQIILLVATLGLELDNFIKRLEITDIGLAFILNAVAVEYIEKYLDYVQDEVLVFDTPSTSRYSIGYGDLDLTYQDDFIKVLDATKKIGVNVLPSHLMVPSKSVSAIIGLSNSNVSKSLAKCANCLPNGRCSFNCIRKD